MWGGAVRCNGNIRECVCVYFFPSHQRNQHFYKVNFISVSWCGQNMLISVCYVNVKAVVLRGMDLMKCTRGESCQTFLVFCAQIGEYNQFILENKEARKGNMADSKPTRPNWKFPLSAAGWLLRCPLPSVPWAQHDRKSEDVLMFHLRNLSDLTFVSTVSRKCHDGPERDKTSSWRCRITLAAICVWGIPYVWFNSWISEIINVHFCEQRSNMCSLPYRS